MLTDRTVITFYGEIDSDRGLVPVAEALGPCSWSLRLVTSGFDGTHYLRADSDLVEFDMDSGQESPFVFSGSVEGGLERALDLLSEFSALLSRSGIRHRIEGYGEPGGDRAPDLYLHHDWSG